MPSSTSHTTATHIKEAYGLYSNGRFKQALDKCDRAIESEPSSPAAHNLRGAVLESLGLYEEAIDAYKTALQYDPNFAEARSNLKNLEMEVKDKTTTSGDYYWDTARSRGTTAAPYEFLVVPFVGQLRSGVFNVENARKVTEQLQDLIDTYAVRGWDFYRVDKVNIQVTPGCLASLLGARVSYVTFDQVIFRRSAAGAVVETE